MPWKLIWYLKVKKRKSCFSTNSLLNQLREKKKENKRKKDRKHNFPRQDTCEVQKIIPWTGSAAQVKIQNIILMVKDLLIETLFLVLATTAVFNLLFYLFEERQLSSNLAEWENEASGKMTNSINLQRCQCKYLSCQILSERSPWCGYSKLSSKTLTRILQWNK